MSIVGFQMAIGGLTVASVRGTPDRLVRLEVGLGMGGPSRCAARLVGLDADAVPAPGDAFSVLLDSRGGGQPVFTGVVRTVAAAPGGVTVHGDDGLGVLARTEVEAVYTDRSAGDIVQDVLDRAGVTAGVIDPGPTLAQVVLRRGARALAQLSQLAALCGVDLYADGAGAVHFAAPAPGSASHTYRYGVDLLAVDLEAAPPAFDSVVVIGDGGGGAQRWLGADAARVTGTAALDPGGNVVRSAVGDRPLVVTTGAVRSIDAATAVAAARATWLGARPVRGSARVLGDPSLEPAARVDLADLPRSVPGARAALRVRAVTHTLDVAGGFVTRMDF